MRVLIDRLVCDLDVELGYSQEEKLDLLGLFDLLFLHDLSSDRREPGWFLSVNVSKGISTKGLYFLISLCIIVEWNNRLD